MNLDRDLLIALMQRFETAEPGLPDNPFDPGPGGILEEIDAVTAFVEAAVTDTDPYLAELDVPGEDRPTAYAVAGFLQGLHIGFEYARRVGVAS